MRTALATIGHGRHRHLERQAIAVDALDPAPDEYLLVSMEPEPWAPERGRVPEVAHLPAGDRLPLAAARNLAIAKLTDRADLVVLIDADCLPAAGLVGAYADAAEVTGGGTLLSGPVGRLGQLPDEADGPSDAELAAARGVAGDKRPVPAPGETPPERRFELFWSLSFAVTTATHARIGGFDERYAGYGAEDTDYGFRARAAGVPFAWAGGAWCYHQHHPVSSPPYEHLGDIVANAHTFRSTWGRWPMEGWLRAFAADGLVEWDPAGDVLRPMNNRGRAGLRRHETSLRGPPASAGSTASRRPSATQAASARWPTPPEPKR